MSNSIRAFLDLAQRRGALATYTDAMRLGVTRRQLDRLVADGVLGRAHRGVYVLAGAPRDHILAVKLALAATGTGAVASHRSAAWLQGLTERAPTLPHVLLDRHRRAPPGAVGHRCGCLPTGCRPFHGVMCTPPALTLADLAAGSPPAEVADAVDRALAGGVVRVGDIARQVEGRGRRRGVDRLRRCLTDRGDLGVPSPSVLESRTNRLLTRHGLPVPHPEYRVEGGRYRIDYAYPECWVAVEACGYTWHHSPDQLARDLARQRKLTLSGWAVLAYTWLEVVYEPERVAGEIRRALQIARSTRNEWARKERRSTASPPGPI